MNTEAFLLDLVRRRRYRGLTPTQVVEAAAERVASDDSDLVLRLAMVSSPEESGDQTLGEVAAELATDDPQAVVRDLETIATLGEIVDGTVSPLKGGGQLQQLFYEDEGNAVLRPFWAAMADSDDPDYRPQLEARLRALAETALAQLDA